MSEPVLVQVGDFQFKVPNAESVEATAVYKNGKAIRRNDRKKLPNGRHVRVVRIEKPEEEKISEPFVTILADGESEARKTQFDDLH